MSIQRVKLLVAPVLCALLLSACDGTTSEQSAGRASTGSLGNYDYAGQVVPSYINKDNSPNNPISNGVATLGRALFYDKKLSSNDTVSCGSCHQQSAAFSDPALVSTGVNGVTGRHSMRLINVRFSEEEKFFWDERAQDLETQTTMPIRDHGEMGFSGANGDPDFDTLLLKLAATEYYPTLFVDAFGNSVITEDRLQDALAEFIRSIQSFDSRYDVGLAQAGGNRNRNFSNFTAEENQGKTLFSNVAQFDANAQRIGGGLGCQGCHSAPEFSIDENSRNNGVIGVANSSDSDITNTRAPTLRDLFNADGIENGPLMHDGSLNNLDDVLSHYNDIAVDAMANSQLDQRLRGNAGGGGANGQKLNLSQAERSAVIAFLKTLTGSAVYTDERWSDPFTPEGELFVD